MISRDVRRPLGHVPRLKDCNHLNHDPPNLKLALPTQRQWVEEHPANAISTTSCECHAADHPRRHIVIPYLLLGSIPKPMVLIDLC